MTNEELNSYFKPASESKRLAGQYVVYRKVQTAYYQNSPATKETKYKLAIVDKKQGNTLVLKACKGFFSGRESITNCYVVSVDVAAKWQRDEYDNDIPYTRDELVALIESIHNPVTA